MKVILLTLFVAIATAGSVEEKGEPVELIVNGVPEGEPLELGDILDIQLKEHVNGEVVAASNILQPLTAAGLVEAAEIKETAAEVIPSPVVLPSPALPEIVETAPVVNPTPVVLPAPALPEVETAPVVNPSPVVLPAPALPEVETAPVINPSPVVLPAPALPEVVLIPGPVVLPEPSMPEVVEPSPVEIPAPEPVSQSPTGEVFNDGTVSVTINTPEEPSVIVSIQSWFSMVFNYFQDGTQTSQQIV